MKTFVRMKLKDIARRPCAGAMLGSVLLSLFTSCEKELDFKYHEIEPLTVIEGTLTEEGARVSITMTTPMGEPMDRTRITDAEVILKDLTAGYVEKLRADEEGYFVSHSGGKDWHDYSLTVMYGDETWTAKSTMFPKTEIISAGFSWIKMPYDHVAVLQVLYADDPTTKGDSYWIRVYRNGEIYSWSEQQDWTSRDGVMNFVTMTTRQDVDEEDEEDLLVDGDEVTVNICRISSGMREYIEAIGNDSNGPMMFTGTHRCLGYFMASAPTETTVVFHPEEIPYQ